MIEAYQALIEPQNEKLKKMMSVMMDDDYEAVPVRVKYPSGTTQIIEDGIVNECDHFGATMGDVDLGNLHYDPETETVKEIDMYRVLVCDQCPAWKIPSGGEWYE